MTPRERVERVIVGVLQQALRDARTSSVIVATGGAIADYVRSLAEGAVQGLSGTGAPLIIGTACKTELLLGVRQAADVQPLGDVYYSQLPELTGAAPPPAHPELAGACGGSAAMDAALRRFYDERLDWASAACDLPAGAAVLLRDALEAARFRRIRVGLVPKLTSRTLGVDLFA